MTSPGLCQLDDKAPLFGTQNLKDRSLELHDGKFPAASLALTRWGVLSDTVQVLQVISPLRTLRSEPVGVEPESMASAEQTKLSHIQPPLPVLKSVSEKQTKTELRSRESSCLIL